METAILTHAWIPACLWAALYTGDYFLTLFGARLFKRQAFILTDGSYELTPEYQRDIDNQRRLSWVFVAWLIGATAFLLLIGYVAAPPVTWLYGGFAGALIVPELAVYLRHWQNIAMYRSLASASPGVSGQLTYTRSFTYRRSAVELAGLTAYTAIAGALTASSILLGGAVGLVLLAWRHLKAAHTSVPATK